MSQTPIVLCWSGGKDSALALDRLLRDPQFAVAGLITHVTAGERRIAMHGVPWDLLQQQASSLGWDPVVMTLPPFPSNAAYEQAFAGAMDRYRSLGVETVAFGDLFLADIRDYRLVLCERLGLRAEFPVWGLDTRTLAKQFITAGYKAVVCCVDGEKLGREFVGCEYNADWLGSLPAGVDPCGEHGEFHTFAYAGPIFRQPVMVQAGAIHRDGQFWRCDLEPLTISSEGVD